MGEAARYHLLLSTKVMGFSNGSTHPPRQHAVPIGGPDSPNRVEAVVKLVPKDPRFIFGDGPVGLVGIASYDGLRGGP